MYQLEGELLSASRRETRNGEVYGVAEFMGRDDRGHRVVAVYVDVKKIEELTKSVGQKLRVPVRIYAKGGSVRTVLAQ